MEPGSKSAWFELVPMDRVPMKRVLDPVLELIERSAWVLGCRRGMCLES
jgi:hypothetical protein